MLPKDGVVEALPLDEVGDVVFEVGVLKEILCLFFFLAGLGGVRGSSVSGSVGQDRTWLSLLPQTL